ncbi:aminopeptidase P family protein [Bacteroidales bacterium OttesenSCG-928-B11]|nr:aminopeptidase P family protein [Bacteroidales bacterium OttesenSCG-928-E04]MDL2309202.1 aminopeptidase P family protein [Bacteroidales bacterium OttesenSCG-928-C03]MDL2312624.1 aminopeptidase P family protein [Bacteroidales bacterium OttesenSCG-928-B11]
MNPFFDAAVYTNRRENLKKKMTSGVALFLGNNEASMNYPANTYRYRQDSNFIYFFGIWAESLAAIIDFDNGDTIIFGNDFEIDDIIWMGNQPTVKELAGKVGVTETRPYLQLADYVAGILKSGRKLHFTPPYRGHNKIELANLTNINVNEIRNAASIDLIKAIVALRSTKEEIEIAEIEKACNMGVEMHETVMRNCKPGVSELELAGRAEGVAMSRGNGVSFPVILSQHGETLHNHVHNAILEEGKLLLMDAGVEGLMGYSSDYTRTIPVSGKFTPKQKAIYEIVLKANLDAIAAAKPGIYNKELHRIAAEVVASGLKELGLMKGDVKEAVEQGAYALFFPHGLGHQMGLDVHDMEDLGENYVGYDETIERSKLFGWSALRMARELKPGFIVTVEPGIYFIPQLIDIWRTENKFPEFINYDKVSEYIDFGGIRIEDDILITKDGHRVLGRHLAKTVEEIEAMMK